MKIYAAGLLLAALVAPRSAMAQAGGFVLGRAVTVDGARNATTGLGAIDTDAITTEEALLLEGREGGLDWRVRAQTAGRFANFPGRANVSIKALSYGRALTDTLSVSAGKQQRVWGAGVAYQPLGFFRTQVNLRDPTDAEGRGEGLPMLHLARLGDPVTIETLIADDWRGPNSGQWAARASTLFGRVEASALLRQRAGARVGAGASATWAGTRVNLYGDLWWGPPERRRMVNDRIAGTIDVNEFVLPSNRGRRVSYALGATWTPANGLALTAELDRRGEGLDGPAWHHLVTTLRTAAANVATPRAAAAYRTLGSGLALLSAGEARHDYLFGRAAWSRGRLSVSTNLTIGLADGSKSLTGVTTYTIAPRWTAVLAATRFGGPQGSEFGLAPVRSVLSLSLRRGFDL